MYIQQLIKLVSNKLNQGTYIRNLSPFLRDYYYQYNKGEIEEYKNILKQTDNFNKYNKLLLYENKDFEMRLIHWGIGSRTKIHNHDNQQCTFILLEGELKEKLYTLNTYQNGSKINKQNQLSYISDKLILPSDVSYIDDKIGYHKIENVYRANEIVNKDCILKTEVDNYNSLSLHIYSSKNNINNIADITNLNELSNNYFENNENNENNKNLLREDYM